MTRHIISLITTLLTVFSGYAQEIPDSICQKSEQVIIKTLPDGTTTLELTGSDGSTTLSNLKPDNERIIIITSDTRENHGIKFRTSNSGWECMSGGFNIGWNFAPQHPRNAPIEPGKSWEIGWFQIAGVRNNITKLTSVSIGVGMDWKNYKITTPDYYFSPDGNGGIDALPYPSGVEPRYSRIKIFTLSLPLMLKQKMPFRLYGTRQWIAVGASLGYSPHGSVLTRWTDDTGRRVRITDKKIGHRRWTCEFVGILGVSSEVGVYVRYQPMSVLRGECQPDFKSLSTGLIFFY